MASDEDWLRALRELLTPLESGALALLEHAPPHDEFGWIDAVPGGARLLAQSDPQAPGHGWLLRLPGSMPRAVLLDADRALDPAGTQLALARQLLRTAWRLREPLAGATIRGEAHQAMHDLRNGLNSVSMTSAVVAAADLPEQLRGFVDDLQGAARRSLRALTELAEWVPPG